MKTISVSECLQQLIVYSEDCETVRTGKVSAINVGYLYFTSYCSIVLVANCQPSLKCRVSQKYEYTGCLMRLLVIHHLNVDVHLLPQ